MSLSIGDRCLRALSKAAASETSYILSALANQSENELAEIIEDIWSFETQGRVSERIIDVLNRARCLSDADAMLAKFEAA